MELTACLLGVNYIQDEILRAEMTLLANSMLSIWYGLLICLQWVRFPHALPIKKPSPMTRLFCSIIQTLGCQLSWQSSGLLIHLSRVRSSHALPIKKPSHYVQAFYFGTLFYFGTPRGIRTSDSLVRRMSLKLIRDLCTRQHFPSNFVCNEIIEAVKLSLEITPWLRRT